jgi:Protein of unknown function (DUF4230)
MDDSDQLSGTGRRGNRGDGPDTVRILPDSTPRSAPGPDADEWRVERPVVRSGTLYTRVPADAAQQVVELGHAIEPMGQQSREVVSAGQRSIQAQDASTPQPVTAVRKGPSACSIIAATLSLLMLSCAVLAFFTLRNGLDGLGKLGGLIPSFGLVTTPTITIDTSRPTVIDRVRALSRLETVHYELEKVVTGKSSGPLPDWFTSDKILLVAHGEVAAGVDLARLQPGDVTVVSDTVTIRLPKSEILYSTLDNDKTYVYDRQTGIFNEPDANLETEIRRIAEEEILKTALEDGILTKATNNAQDVLRTLITGLGYEDVRFIEGP